MFILNVPPDSAGKVPLLMVQAGSNANRNVVVQDPGPVMFTLLGAHDAFLPRICAIFCCITLYSLAFASSNE